MTPKEHELVIGMFAMQMEFLYSMADILKSRGLLEADDLHAFWSIRPPELRQESVQRAHMLYELLAKELGVEVPGQSGTS